MCLIVYDSPPLSYKGFVRHTIIKKLFTVCFKSGDRYFISHREEFDIRTIYQRKLWLALLGYMNNKPNLRYKTLRVKCGCVPNE